ncbi:hypothetical protein E3N88_35471 [Mikania micrantha]|uniref:Uncharacterized protein n=1 Tax=Mikania micrantha TaxID=192012 RepID=A0A5N6M1J5_9ASTR|nr:hypothetical protein E3N88_35471 [Mikania micrantha]
MTREERPNSSFTLNNDLVLNIFTSVAIRDGWKGYTENGEKIEPVTELDSSPNLHPRSNNNRWLENWEEDRIEKGSIEDIFNVKEGILPNSRGGFSPESPLGVEDVFRGSNGKVRFPWEKPSPEQGRSGRIRGAAGSRAGRSRRAVEQGARDRGAQPRREDWGAAAAADRWSGVGGWSGGGGPEAV